MKYEKRIALPDLEASRNLAKNMLPYIEKNSVLALYGELGAGKTYFTQQLCKFLEVDDYVNSPTYVIMNQYQGKFPINHLDLYRLNSEEEVLELGPEELFTESMTIIEWPQISEFCLPPRTIRMYFEYNGESRNVLIVSPEELKFISE